MVMTAMVTMTMTVLNRAPCKKRKKENYAGD